METQRSQHGFTLPSVLLASVLMMIMLAAAMQITSASAHALRERYYNQLAREAAESGILRAQACTPGGSKPRWWTDTAKNPLTPGTDCTGVGTGSPKYFTIIDTKPRVGLRYEVGEVIRDTTRGSTGQQSFKVLGYADILRGDTGEDDNGRVYKFSNIGQTRALLNTANIQMGYFRHTVTKEVNGKLQTNTYMKTHTVRIDENGRVKTFGDNTYGQLGNGNRNNSAAAVSFGSVDEVERIYANRLSSGHATYAIRRNGEVYTAGKNASGQLGLGYTSEAVTDPAKVILPAGYEALDIVTTDNNSFLLARDTVGGKNVLLSAGACGTHGTLGRDCANDTNYPRFEKVTLLDNDNREIEPYFSGSANDDIHELVADRYSVMVLGMDGNVYAWGGNYRGQIGLYEEEHHFTDKIAKPKMITAYLSAGQRVYGLRASASDYFTKPLSRSRSASSVYAASLATDGISYYVLMSNGRVFGSGDNTHGQMGDFRYDYNSGGSYAGFKAKIYGHGGPQKGFCIHMLKNKRALSAGYAVGLSDCIGQKGEMATLGMDVYDDGYVRILSRFPDQARPGAKYEYCLDSFGSAGNPSILGTGNEGVGFTSCVHSNSQRWTLEEGDDGVRLRPKDRLDLCLSSSSPNTADGRIKLKPCTMDKADAKKSIYFLISSPRMNEISLKDVKQVHPQGSRWNRGYSNTENSVLAMAADNRSVTFIGRPGSTDATAVLSLGHNGFGMLGGGTQQNARCDKICPRPVKFLLPGSDNTPKKILNVSLGITGATDKYHYNNIYVITNKGNVYGSGSNVFGQLGGQALPGGGDSHSAHPILMNNWRETEGGGLISPQMGAVDISAGAATALVFAEDGRVYTVGNNASGQLGGGTIGGYSNVVSPRPNLAPPSEPPFFY